MLRYMRKVLAGLFVFASVVFAGERYLGTIRTSGNASATNRTTTNPFLISGPVKLSIYCVDAAPLVCTDNDVCTTDGGVNHGITIPANTIFPTSIARQTPDASVAIVSTLDAGCQVFSRTGTE